MSSFALDDLVVIVSGGTWVIDFLAKIVEVDASPVRCTFYRLEKLSTEPFILPSGEDINSVWLTEERLRKV